MLQTSTLRPGYLVGLSTTIRGNVRYRTTTIESEHIEDDGTAAARWETERRVTDPAEQARAVVVRSKCRSLVTARCAQTDFGLLCPEDKAPELEAAIAEARALAREFNQSAETTYVTVRAITGKVAQDDAQAVRQINAEVTQLIDDMERGLRRLDVAAVREAAEKAREVGKMLSNDARERVQSAIKVARDAAKKIVKAGEGAAIEVDKAILDKVRSARTAFLDLDDDGTEVAAPVTTGRAIDLDPSVAAASAEYVASARAQLIVDRVMSGADLDDEPAQIAAPAVRVSAQLDLI